jgi:N-acetylglucosaminyldiphosphoundecaprenol N-acetyl-beta-D-mannosaminyltransferase
MEDALRFTESLIQRGGAHYCCFCEASLLASLIRDQELARSLESAGAIFPDGVALMLLARTRGVRLPSRVPGPSFLLAACAYGVSRGWRHFLYGGAPGVPDALARRLSADYPGIAIAGTFSPPFRPLTAPEEGEVARMIGRANPTILWVALGSPKQELWAASHVGKMQVPLILPVGAAFDFHSGARPWAPGWVRKCGMEWAFRGATGGRRIFLRNLACVSTVALYLAQSALRSAFNRKA